MKEKFSQFGGVGGQHSPFSPGRSPMFGAGNRGYGINNFGPDISFDGLLNAARNESTHTSERSIESRLEAFHDSIENDVIQYELTPEERKILDFKNKIRRKEHYIKSLREKHHLKEKEDEAYSEETLEGMLNNVHKNKGLDFTKFASYFRKPGTIKTDERFMVPIEEYENADNLDLLKNKMTQPFTGMDPQYEPGTSLETYFKSLNNPTFPNMHSGVPNRIDEPYTPNIGINHNLAPEIIPSLDPKSKDFLNLPPEEKLKLTRKFQKNIDKLDLDPLRSVDWDEYLKGKWPERSYVSETAYKPDGLGGYSTVDIPMVSNNPYFGVIS